MKKNILIETSEKIAAVLAAIASSQRIAILLAIGSGEACVCHLETALGWRQAYISQHLMALRKAGLLQGRREGKYIYYRLTNPAFLSLLISAADLNEIPSEIISEVTNRKNYPSCDCPQCALPLIQLSS